MNDFYVCIVKDATNEPSNVMGPMSERQADKVHRGAMINLNHDEWHVSTLREEDLPDAWKGRAE